MPRTTRRNISLHFFSPAHIRIILSNFHTKKKRAAVCATRSPFSFRSASAERSILLLWPRPSDCRPTPCQRRSRTGKTPPLARARALSELREEEGEREVSGEARRRVHWLFNAVCIPCVMRACPAGNCDYWRAVWVRASCGCMYVCMYKRGRRV